MNEVELREQRNANLAAAVVNKVAQSMTAEFTAKDVDAGIAMHTTHPEVVELAKKELSKRLRALKAAEKKEAKKDEEKE